MKQVKVLRVDASARREGSVTRQLADKFLARLGDANKVASITTRDLADAPDFVTEGWMNANFTDEAERSDEQKQLLATSDSLVAELEQADLIVIGVPVYNFGVPAALKAWIDMVARARKTFRYTENGPVGLLENKKAVLVVASGGTQVGSEIDFATGYMKHVLGFIGIHDVDIIAADQLMVDADAAMNSAHAMLDETTQSIAA